MLPHISLSPSLSLSLSSPVSTTKPTPTAISATDQTDQSPTATERRPPFGDTTNHRKHQRPPPTAADAIENQRIKQQNTTTWHLAPPPTVGQRQWSDWTYADEVEVGVDGGGREELVVESTFLQLAELIWSNPQLEVDRQIHQLGTLDDSPPPSRTAAVMKTGNTSGAVPSEPLWPSTEQYGCVLSVLNGDAVTNARIRTARSTMAGSLVFVAVHQGDEILALLPGTIIRSDGVVATCASRLSFPTIKELQVSFEVLNGKVTCDGTLLSADFSSNIAFIKFTSPRQQKVAPVAKMFAISALAVGCTSRGRGLHDTDFTYCLAFTGHMLINEIELKQTDARTSGQDIHATVQARSGSVIGGPLVVPELGVIGIIHHEAGRNVIATPIDEVLKYLECLMEYSIEISYMVLYKKYYCIDYLVISREQDPKSVSKSFGDIDLEARPEIEPIHLDDEIAFEDIFKDRNARKQSACSSGTSSQPRANCKRGHDTCDEESDIKTILDKLGQVADAITRLTWDRLDVQALHDEVMKMEGFDEAFLGSAFDHLVENERLGKAFMAKSINLRKIWLEKFSM
ncbi:hypothetical protein Vadar_006358 [Vaccinium darrowii]|uniref:Uncharacterized protein n=1 Tax=Vaccinium darrowii TaxID=229202 RepID=A0ACB7XX35_9ERIC|nr:hypothetical protein Vadar_006358 [Vaccinium darrowii]